MTGGLVFLFLLVSVVYAQNGQGNLDLKEAFDAALIRMLSDGSYDTIYTADTGGAPTYYYGDCAVPTAQNLDVTYPYPTATAGGVLADVLSSSSLRISCPVTSSGLWVFNTTTGSASGIDYDIVREIFDRIGENYGKTISFTWVPALAASDVLSLLQNGSADIAFGNLSPGSSYYVSSRNNIDFWPTCATRVNSNYLYYYSSSGAKLYNAWTDFKTYVEDSSANSLTILALANVAGTIAKAQTNFPNAQIVTCPTISDCMNQLVNSSVAGLYGTFNFDNANVYALADPQIVPISGLIRRDACPTTTTTSSSSTTCGSSSGAETMSASFAVAVGSFFGALLP